MNNKNSSRSFSEKDKDLEKDEEDGSNPNRHNRKTNDSGHKDSLSNGAEQEGEFDPESFDDQTNRSKKILDDGRMQRKLKPRHLSMIAIGGTIGTGLFLGSGEALRQGGPLGLTLGYATMGLVVYSMMVALGEMVTMFPMTGSFIHFATRFVDPALGFAVGFNFWYSYAVTLPTEITAASLVVQYWSTNVHVAVWITIFLVTICGINFFGVKWYGEAEFWFSAIKVLAVIVLIILGIILDLGGGPNHDRIGFRNWINPGPFNQLNDIKGPKGRFLAFWSVFLQSAFSYGGTEIVALTAGEAQNPRKTVPEAIKTVFYRIALFYIGGVTVIGLLVPYNSPGLLGQSKDAASSPFVIAIQNAGISVLPDIINAVILVAAYSAGNSDMYAGSRTLYGLASDKMAPSIFKRCTKSGLPVAGLLVTGIFGLLAYMNVNNDGATVFNWLFNISSVSGLFTWWTIFLSYLRFHSGLAYHGIDRNKLHYKAPYQPYLSYFGFLMVNLIIIFNGFTVFLKGNWSPSKFIAAYITIPVFIGSFLFWKFFKKTQLVKIELMDFHTKQKELIELSEDEDENYGEEEVEEKGFKRKLKRLNSLLF